MTPTSERGAHVGENAEVDHAPMDAALANGVAGYVARMRSTHGAVYADGRAGVVYSGCRCGEVGCNAPIWLVHVDRLIDSYVAKVQDLARETTRTTALIEVINGVVEASRPGTTKEQRDEAWAAVGAVTLLDKARQNEDFMDRLALVREQYATPSVGRPQPKEHHMETDPSKAPKCGDEPMPEGHHWHGDGTVCDEETCWDAVLEYPE